MLTHLKFPILGAIVAAMMAVACPVVEAQPGYYTYDLYGGRFNGATMRPGLFGRTAANAPAGYAPAANVAFGTSIAPAAYAGTNPCNTCTTVARPACNTCTTVARPIQHTVGYAPVTSYRLGFTRTAYRPVAACDACGNQTVTYQPYRTLLPWLRRVPVTTYRPVMTAATAPGCNSCATQVSSPIMQSSYAAAPSSCSSCSAGGAITSPGTGALPVPSLRPAIVDQYGQGTAVQSQRVIMQQPAQAHTHDNNGNGTAGAQPVEAQRPPSNGAEQQKSRLKALPPAQPQQPQDNLGAMPETRVPRLFDPNDKSAQFAPTNRFEVAPVVYAPRQPVRHTPGGSRPLDDSGWHSER